MRLQRLAKRARRRSIWSTQTRHSTWPAHALVTASSRANYDMPRATGLIRSVAETYLGGASDQSLNLSSCWLDGCQKC